MCPLAAGHKASSNANESSGRKVVVDIGGAGEPGEDEWLGALAGGSEAIAGVKHDLRASTGRARAPTGSVEFDFFLASLHSPSIAGHLNSINWLVDSQAPTPSSLFALTPSPPKTSTCMELANGLAGDASLRVLGLQANDMMPTVSFLGHQISAVQGRRGLSPNTEPGAPSLAHRPLPCCSHSPKLQGVASAPRPGTSSDELDWRSLTE